MFASWGRTLADHRRLAAGVAILSLALALTFVTIALIVPDHSSGASVQDTGFTYTGYLLVRDFTRTGNPVLLLIALAHPS